MTAKTIAMMMAVGCAATVLTGCGVKKELYEAKVGELNTATAEIESLKGKITDLDSLYSNEKTKVQNGVMALDSATERIKAAEKKEAATASALADEKSKVAQLESSLTAAKAATTRANDATAAVKGELESLQAEYAKLQARFEQYQKNMSAMSSPSKASAPAAATVKKTAEQTALEILNEMSSK